MFPCLGLDLRGDRGVERENPSNNDKSRCKPAWSRKSILDLEIVVRKDFEDDHRRLRVMQPRRAITTIDKTRVRYPTTSFRDLDYKKWIDKVMLFLATTEIPRRDVAFYVYYLDPSKGNKRVHATTEKTWHKGLEVLFEANQDTVTFYIAKEEVKKRKRCRLAKPTHATKRPAKKQKGHSGNSI
jgi:hypothetical protein